MNGRRLLIFGCGYVGSRLSEEATALGYEVWIHSRNRMALDAVQSVPAERKIVAQLQSGDWHHRLQGHWDLVVNLVSASGGGLDGYRTSYIEGNQSILDWSGKSAVERFIYTSATSVYSQSDGSLVTEEDVPAFDQLSPSGRLLREAECLVLANSSIPDTVILRLGGIYGPGRHLYLDRLLKEPSCTLPGDGEAFLNLIYREDITGAILHLDSMDSFPEREVFNLVDDQPSRKQEIVDWLARRIGTGRILFDPAVPGARDARRSRSGKLPNRRISNARIGEMTGWRPRYPNYRKGYAAILGTIA